MKKIEEKIINEFIQSRPKDQVDLNSFKRVASKKYKIPYLSNIELLKIYHKLTKKERTKHPGEIELILRTRPVRSLSGIVNISVLTKPYPCPGQCLYCPDEKGMPKSYLSGEPAAERAKKLNYNPYLQVKRRIEMLEMEGHPTEKIELRIVGGTWSYYPKHYQEWFIKRCFKACNQAQRQSSLAESQRKNEKAKHRIVGLSIETRPDFIDEGGIRRLRKFGVTLVELGVQSIYNDVLKRNLRGHTAKETIEATRLLKDAGFKVLYQMMPNLPGSNQKQDLKMFEAIFSHPEFQPDMLKIYPCVVLKEAPLYKLWRQNKYRPYTEKQLLTSLSAIKKIVPPYVRIQRISRDIPAKRMATGPKRISNLRQMLAEKMQEEGWRCKCIRCQEIKKDYDLNEKIHLFRQDYEASNGHEIFLSFENSARSKLHSLLRLRISSEQSSQPALNKSAIIREIHTYGQQLSLHQKEKNSLSPQHKGLGKKLVKEAEIIAKNEFKLNKMAVIAGIGARDYFRKLGYKLESSYMIKQI